MPAPQFRGVLAIAVPASAGTYTDNFVGQPGPSSAANNFAGNASLLGLTAVLQPGFPVGTVIELWFLDPTPGVNPTVIGNYFFGQTLLIAAGSITIPLGSYPAVLIRAQSGGNAGTATVMYSAD